MNRVMFLLVFSAVILAGSVSGAQTYAPEVTMRVTTPDGQTQDVTARESGTGTLTLKDGTVYEFRPTIHDEPFTKVTIAIFKAATATESTAPLGEVQVAKGAAAVDSKTKPAFKIAVKSIGPAKTS